MVSDRLVAGLFGIASPPPQNSTVYLGSWGLSKSRMFAVMSAHVIGHLSFHSVISMTFIIIIIIINIIIIVIIIILH